MAKNHWGWRLRGILVWLRYAWARPISHHWVTGEGRWMSCWKVGAFFFSRWTWNLPKHAVRPWHASEFDPSGRPCTNTYYTENPT